MPGTVTPDTAAPDYSSRLSTVTLDDKYTARTGNIFLSGIQHFVEGPEGMATVEPEVKKFMQQVPVTWDETIFLEPLGYIGYFSQRKVHDYPGLVSPAVVAARRKIGRPDYPWAPYYWGKAAEEIKPDWIVARPHEEAQLKASPYLRENYQLVRVFNAADAILARGEFPGSSVCYNDVVFEIFRRRRTAP